ncbi:MAG: hypothetical protein R3C24_10600 [Cyanobacteriota/Melainabacteria group bacterium]
MCNFANWSSNNPYRADQIQESSDAVTDSDYRYLNQPLNNFIMVVYGFDPSSFVLNNPYEAYGHKKVHIDTMPASLPTCSGMGRESPILYPGAIHPAISRLSPMIRIWIVVWGGWYRRWADSCAWQQANQALRIESTDGRRDRQLLKFACSFMC